MQATAWEKMFVNMYLTDNVYLYYTENADDSTIDAKQPIFFKKLAQYLARHFTNEDI